MGRWFADTSFWIALSSRRDQYHSTALAWHAVSLRAPIRIVTTEAVLWEWLNALASPGTRAIAAEGYDRLHRDDTIEIIPIDTASNRRVFDLYRSRPDKGWSLTDCLSFVVMQERDMSEALTMDHHFEQVGFRALMRAIPGP